MRVSHRQLIIQNPPNSYEIGGFFYAIKMIRGVGIIKKDEALEKLATFRSNIPSNRRFKNGSRSVFTELLASNNRYETD